MFDASSRDLIIQVSYFVTAVLFISGLKRMSSPVTARSGITWDGAGMLVATAVTFAYPGMSNYEWIIPAILVGGGFAWWSGKRVAITDMPQMIALYNCMVGGAAAAIALSVGLVLLGLALTGHFVVAGHGAQGLLGLALDALDGAPEAFFGAALLVVRHKIPPWISWM